MPLSEALNHRYRGITAGKKKKNKYVLVELFSAGYENTKYFSNQFLVSFTIWGNGVGGCQTVKD